jgi:hypothetical protein
MKIPLSLLCALLGLAVATPVVASATPAKTCRATSPDFRAAVIELYTSEGCSSCPPADAWLGQLPRADLDAGRVVPLALHVDYWNHLGWRDPFSQSPFTARQRALAAHNRSRTIYTPGFFLNGREWRGWHRNDLAARVVALARERPAARIQLDASTRGDTLHLHATVTARTALPGNAQLYLAVLENGLVSAIPAGENAGRTLRHDHVVRYLSGGFALTSRTTTVQHALPLPASWRRATLGLVAFIEDSASGEILQALALPRCPGAHGK